MARKKCPPAATPEIAFAYYMGALQETDECIPWRGTIQAKRGYGTVMISGKNILAHRLAYRLFVGSLGGDDKVRHTCDNPPCVNPRHLLKGTQAQNMQDMVARKRHRFGTARPEAKLNPEAVREIRALLDAGWTKKALADRYGVAWGTIQCVVDGRTWKHVS